MGGETTRGRGRRPTGTTGKFVQRIRGTILDLDLDLDLELAQRPPVSITLRAVLTGADQGRAAARRGPDDGQVESRRRTWPGVPVRAIRSRSPITSKPALQDRCARPGEPGPDPRRGPTGVVVNSVIGWSVVVAPGRVRGRRWCCGSVGRPV